jgi:hypothetical protein
VATDGIFASFQYPSNLQTHQLTHSIISAVVKLASYLQPLSPAAAAAAAAAAAGRPYSRTFSLDGESDMLLETQERLDSEDDDAGEVSSSSMRWQQQQQKQGGRSSLHQQAPERPFRSSAGLRQRAVTAAAAAAAAAAGESRGVHHVGPMHSSMLLQQESDVQQQQVPGGGSGFETWAPYASQLEAAGETYGTVLAHQQQVLGADLFAGSGVSRHAFGSSSSGKDSSQDPVLAAAAARAALSRSYHLPIGSLNPSAAAAAAAVSVVDLQQVWVRQSYERCVTGSAAGAAAPLGAGPGLNPFEGAAAAETVGAGGLCELGPGRLQHAAQGRHGSSGTVSCSGAALVTEAAGLLMLPQKGQQQLH